MAYDLHPKLKRFFEPAHPREAAFGYAGRDLTRAFFEVLRNIVVISAIKFFADKTGSALLSTLFNISMGMMVLFFYSFIVQWDLRIFQQFRQSAIYGLGDFALGLFISLACTYGCFILINTAVGEIAKAQGQGAVTSVLADPFDQGVAAWNRGDHATALQLFRPLAEHGNIRAQTLLGSSYEEGLGVPQDDVEAAKWYQRAADSGDDIAQYHIGIMHQNGQGVPRDLVRAYMWLDLAAMRGHQGAAMNRDRLAKSMTAAQIAEAQELARQWKPTTRVGGK